MPQISSNSALLVGCSLSVARGFSAVGGVQGGEESYAAALTSLRLARMRILAEASGARIAEAAGKGLGAFATRRIAVHERVGEYTGECLTQRDVDARYGPKARSPELWTPADAQWAATREANAVGCSGNYIFQVDEDLYMDAEDLGAATWTRFLNHGSNPNLAIHSLAKGMDGKPKVCFEPPPPMNPPTHNPPP